MCYRKFVLDVTTSSDYNRVMETNDIYTRRVLPDQRTGMLPTEKQLEVLMCLNPLKNKGKTYSDVAAELGITINAVKSRMKGLKSRCPVIYQAFRNVRFKKPKKRKQIFEEGCHHCGCIVPKGQDMCFRCWRTEDRKENPRNYDKDRMFPANGKTMSKIKIDQMETTHAADNWLNRGSRRY